MVAEAVPIDGARLNDHVDPGPHRRKNLGIGLLVRCPGIAAATSQLETASVDPEQNRGSVPLCTIQANMELTAYRAFRPVTDGSESLATARSF